MAIELLNGAFVSEFQKGEKGKPGKWITTAVVEKIGKQKDDEPHKEVPQYPIINDIEASAKSRFQSNLKTSVIDITKFLKNLSNG